MLCSRNGIHKNICYSSAHFCVLMASVSLTSEMLSVSTSTISENLKGFPVEILGDAMNAKFQCWYCNLVLRNPVQCYCGHRLCRNCKGLLFRNSETGSPILCKLCEEENAIGDESYLKEDEIYPDNAIRREMSKLPVHCIFPGCEWTGQFKDYESHVESCQFATVVCEICNDAVLKTRLVEHEAGHQGSALCPIGCEQQVSSDELTKHIEDNLVPHFEIIVRKISSVERILWGTQGPTEGRCISDRMSDLDRNVRHLQDKIRNIISSTSDAAVKQGATAATFTASGDTPETHTMLSSTSEKLMIYEGVITVLNREVEKLTLQVEAIERQRLLERELLDTLDRKVRSTERLIAMKDATIAELELRVTGLEQTSYDGTLLWRIGDLQRKRQEAVSGRATSIYSPPFYTSKTGYKMCARLYLNGDGMGKGTHVSLFFVVMRGNFDPLLKWPFRQKVTLMFIDQNGREHVVDAFRPDPTSSSFKRPTTEMNIASGCPLLMPLTALDSTVNAYVKDNTAFIKIIVNCDDIT